MASRYQLASTCSDGTQNGTGAPAPPPEAPTGLMRPTLRGRTEAGVDGPSSRIGAPASEPNQLVSNGMAPEHETRFKSPTRFPAADVLASSLLALGRSSSTGQAVPNEPNEQECTIHIFDYSLDRVEESHDMERMLAGRPEWATVRWVNIESVGPIDPVRTHPVFEHLLRNTFGEHADVAIESARTKRQRVKVHGFGRQLFLFARIPMLPDDLCCDKGGFDALWKRLAGEWVCQACQGANDASRAQCGGCKLAKPLDGVVEYEAIIFVYDGHSQSVFTYQEGKEGDCWPELRMSLRGVTRRERAGRALVQSPSSKVLSAAHARQTERAFHYVRQRGAIVLFWLLFNEALKMCDNIDSSLHEVNEHIMSAYDEKDRLKDEFDANEINRVSDALADEIRRFSRQALGRSQSVVCLVARHWAVPTYFMFRCQFSHLLVCRTAA